MLLESDDVTLGGGALRLQQVRQVGHRLPKSPAPSYRAMKLPPGTDPGLVATRFWEPPNFAYPFGAHIAVTEIDRETGEIDNSALRRRGRLRQHHQSAAGRRPGSRRHRAGSRTGALRACCVRRGRPVAHRRADGLRDSPGSHDAAWIECSHTITPSPVNPLGVKGVGEAGTIGCFPGAGELSRGCAEPARRQARRHADDTATNLESHPGRRPRMIAQEFEYSATSRAQRGAYAGGERREAAGRRHEPRSR